MDYFLTFTALLPEIVLLAFLCFILCVDVMLSERQYYITYYLTQCALISVMCLTYWQSTHFTQKLIILNGHYRLDQLAILAKWFIYLFSLFSFAYAYAYLKDRQIARRDYYLIGLSAVLGMSIMATGGSLLTIYLGLELLSLSLYAMVAMYKHSSVATEAAMKYYIMGSFASGMLLYGISLLYGVTGSIHLHVIQAALMVNPDTLSVVALLFILVGLIFKFGAVPFHMWIPDVYQGSATSVTIFIASASKVVAFVIILRVLGEALPSLAFAWSPLLMVIAILSMAVGNIIAIVQTNLKRMLAYSSIGHIGYTLLGILVGPIVPEAYSIALFYIITYSIVAAGGFAVIALMSQQGIDLDHLDDYRGLNTRKPWLAFMMLILLFSMAGVPPTVGFFAKLGILQVLVQGGYVWLAVLALLFALIGAYYYLRLVMYMYFEEPAKEVAKTPIHLSKEMWVLVSINGIAALLLGLFPNSLIELLQINL